MAIHQVSKKHSIFYVLILYAYMYVAPQDESCRYCYDLCNELRLFSLRAIWYMCTLLYVYCSPISNMGKYHVSVRHTTVSMLPCWFSVFDSIAVFLLLVHDRLTLPCLHVFLCQFLPNLGVFSPVGFHKCVAANLNVPS